jgi:hypothetical protein
MPAAITPSLRATGFEDEDDDENEEPCEGRGKSSETTTS